MTRLFCKMLNNVSISTYNKHVKRQGKSIIVFLHNDYLGMVHESYKSTSFIFVSNTPASFNMAEQEKGKSNNN